MADGRIRISVEVDGKEITMASSALDGLEDSAAGSGKGLKAAEGAVDSVADKSAKMGAEAKKAGDQVKGMGDQTQGAGGKTQGFGKSTDTATGSVKNLALSMGLVKVASAAFSVMQSSMDSAIKRFDTLAQFPKVLQALGVSAEDSERAMTNLGDGIDGLPTTLNDISASAQRMYTSFNDIDKATDTALALNNALLGSGASADQARRGSDQYTKALQTGRIQMDTWNTLQETMDIGLIKIAEGFGYAGKTAKDDLYNALQDGTVTMDEFNDKLIEVGTGTGIMADLARENSLGIGTSITNLRNSAARGLADMIAGFDELTEAVTGKNIAQNLDSLKFVVNSAFKLMSGSIKAATPFLIAFVDGIKAAIPIVQTLMPLIIGLATAYAAYTIINKVNAAFQVANAAMKAVSSSTAALTALTKAKTVAEIAGNNVTAAYTAAHLASVKAIGLKNIALALLSGNLKLSTAAVLLKAKAVGVLNGVLTFMSGPIGWVVAGIAALTAVTVVLVKWFNRASEDGQAMTNATEEMSGAMDDLAGSVDSSSKAYENNETAINASADANNELAKKIDELSQKENKSAAEKALLTSYVEELNGQMEDLNLSYSEEADMLSMSSEQLTQRIDLMKEQETAQASQERLTEILKEQSEIEQQLSETNKLREEWNDKLEEGTVKGKEHSEAVDMLNESQEELENRQHTLRSEYEQTEEQLTSSMENITAATEDNVGKQTLLFDDLSESQQATVESMKSTWQEYQEQATDMFDRLSEKSEISIGKMTKNLEENQRIITNWSENIAKLAERGVDEGLLETLRAAGPESAGHVNALVNASDAELEKLSDAFADGGDVATNALATSLGIEESGVMDAVGHLVTDTEASLKDQIASADFTGIGGDVSDGLADGIGKTAKNASNASRQMAMDVEDASRDQLGIHSPSVKYREMGMNLTQGLALGINAGTSLVTRAITQMFNSVQVDSTRSFRTITRDYDQAILMIQKSLSKLPQIAQLAFAQMTNRIRILLSQQQSVLRQNSNEIPRNFNELPGQMQNVGANAMLGLQRGLNGSAGRVMSTARAIANNVAATMRQALQINSPSKVMDKEVGRWIPEGVAQGISGNTKNLYDTLKKMTRGMIMPSTPEIALGASNAVYNVGSSHVSAITGNRGHSVSGKGDGQTVGLLSEQNKLLKAILDKDANTYLDGDVLTNKVNENNALKSALELF